MLLRRMFRTERTPTSAFLDAIIEIWGPPRIHFQVAIGLPLNLVCSTFNRPACSCRNLARSETVCSCVTIILDESDGRCMRCVHAWRVSHRTMQSDQTVDCCRNLFNPPLYKIRRDHYQQSHVMTSDPAKIRTSSIRPSTCPTPSTS